MNVVVVVLAAGASRRLGRPKQEVVIEGRAILTRAVESAIDSRASGVVVVLGREANRLRRLVPAGAEIVVNPDWREGIASSIRAAVEHLRARDAPPEAVVLSVCDQPALDSRVVDRLIEAWSTRRTWAAAARYAGRLGVPAIFDRSAFDALARLSGDRGARDLLRTDPNRVTPVDWPAGADDIDERGDVPDECDRRDPGS